MTKEGKSTALVSRCLDCLVLCFQSWFPNPAPLLRLSRLTESFSTAPHHLLLPPCRERALSDSPWLIQKQSEIMRPYTMKTRACDTDRKVSSPFRQRKIYPNISYGKKLQINTRSLVESAPDWVWVCKKWRDPPNYYSLSGGNVYIVYVRTKFKNFPMIFELSFWWSLAASKEQYPGRKVPKTEVLKLDIGAS